MIVNAGGVPPIVALLRSSDLDVVEQASWALGNIAGDNVMYRNLVLSTGALQLLSSLPEVCIISIQDFFSLKFLLRLGFLFPGI